MNGTLLIINASEVVTCSGTSAKHGKEMEDIGVIKNGAVFIEDGIIKAVGKSEELVKKFSKNNCNIIDAQGKAVIPGFIDSHTHFIFGGYRADEFNWRLNGISYMEIMERGGGIINTVRDTRKASKKELIATGLKRLDSMLSFGVTTVEGKSGYGLDLETEINQLEAMKELNKLHPIDIVQTYLGAHATPKEYQGREDEYIDFIINDVLPKVVNGKLAEFCDVFCEKGVFSIEQSRKLLMAAKSMGLKLKIHADEIVSTGGAELAAEVGAISADHLLAASDKGIEAMAKGNVIATLLPCTAFSLRENFARGRKMIDSGCAVALATDFNPGSCFTESLALVFALACIGMDLKVEEVLTALTINAAAAIGRADKIGSIDIGKYGDILILEYPSYKYIPYHVGVSVVEKVIKMGNVVFDKEHSRNI